MKEIQKDVPGFEGMYSVSNKGNVKSNRFNKERLMKSQLHNGYKMVELCVDNKRHFYGVHQLVAMAFLPNPQNKPQVNHMDRCRHNNNVSNLEQVTCSENVADAYKKGVKPRATHQNQPKQRLVIDIVTGTEYFSIREASRKTGLKRDTIKRSAVEGKAVCHNLHKFIYKNT